MLYLRQIQRHCEASTVPWCLMVALLALSLIGALLYITRPMDLTLARWLLGTLTPAGTLFYAWLCLQGSGKFLKPSRALPPALHVSRRFSPLLFSLVLICFVCSNQYWFINAVLLGHRAIYPSWQQYLLFPIYPLLMMAYLFLPSQSLSRLARVRIFLDSIIILAALTTLSYYFLLAPLLAKGVGTLQARIVASIFPLADLVVFFCLLLVALRSDVSQLRPVLILLGASTFGLFLSHAIHFVEVLSHAYVRLSLADTIFFLNGMLLVGAAQTLRRILDRSVTAPIPELKESEQVMSPARWKVLLPPAFVFGFGLIALGLRLLGEESFSGQITVVYTGSVVILLLMVLRQLLAIYEVNALRTTLQARNRSLALLNTRLEQQATTDPLTHLPNHRTLIALLEIELSWAAVFQAPCSLLFLDLDHFKSINDRYGHLVGDAVLHRFGKVIAEALRPSDHVGRWGGEEFVAIVPGASADEARAIAERLRLRVARQLFPHGLHLTCSLGIATYPHNARDQNTLLALADAAMYAAKRLGRNQTRAANDPYVLVLGMAAESAALREEQAVPETVEAFVTLQEVRDQTISQHEHRVAALSRKLALALGLSEDEAYTIGLGGLLHDLGKIALPDSLLLEREQLSETEFQTVRTHPAIGADVLSTVPALQDLAQMVRSHHERIDGNGYPDHLRGEAIPLGARIIAVADVYDTLLHRHAGRSTVSSVEALRVIQQSASTQFDVRVVEALERVLAEDQIHSIA